MRNDGRIGTGWIGAALAVVAAIGLVAAAVSLSPQAAPASRPMAAMTMTGRPLEPVALAKVANAPTLVPEGWSASATSHASGHPAAAVLDSGTSYWQSSGRGPQSITINMGNRQQVSALTYEPRQGPTVSGAIGRFEVSVSRDGRRFGAPIATGTWADTTDTKKIDFGQRNVGWIRLTALAPAGSDSFYTASQIAVAGGLRPAVLAASTAPAVSTNPGVSGQWGANIGFPLVPVSSALLPHNQLLMWSADGTLGTTVTPNHSWSTQTAVLDLNTGVVTKLNVTNTHHNMFCPGVAILPDGRILVAGGESDRQTSIYDPATNAWSAGPLMNIARGYNGATLLSDGQVFTLGGSWTNPGTTNGSSKTGEVWSQSGGWRELTGAKDGPIMTRDPVSGAWLADAYGWFFATSGGRVFHAGPSKQMHWITTAGAGSITNAGARGTSDDELNGNAVYYDTNKILTLGGAVSYSAMAPATNQANIVDISSGTPTVTRVGPLVYPTTLGNSVALPTGQVLVLGGATHAVGYGNQDSILNAELWDPTTGKFSLMAAESTPRIYHSTAVLLPDGRVFNGGGGLCTELAGCRTNHPDGQIYSPPYLFNADGTAAARPVIVAAPTSATDGQTITVTTDGPVSSFSIVRYGEATHSTDNDQRRLPLRIVSSSGNSYQLAVPSDPGVALAGPYMLFAMNGQGTPSVSTTISIANAPSAAPANSYAAQVARNAPAAAWTLDDTAGPTAADSSGNGDTGTYSPTGVTYGAASPVASPGGTAVTLDGVGGSIVSSQGMTDPTTFSEEMWFKTTTTRGGYMMGFHSAAGPEIAGYQDRTVWMNDNGQLTYNVSAAIGRPILATAPGRYNDGQWHHVVATGGGNGLHLYIDGGLAASGATTPGAAYYGYWRVGAGNVTGLTNQASSNYFAGTVSNVAFYSHELTATQVLADEQASPIRLPSSAPSNAYSSVVAGSGPSLYWPLNDASGPSAADVSGNAQQGVYSVAGVAFGAPSPVEGPGGTGVTLDGSAGQIVASHATTSPATFSEEVWFRTTSTKGGYLMGFAIQPSGASGSKDRQVYLSSSGKVNDGVSNGRSPITIQSPGAYNDGRWHAVVATEGSGGMRLYVDGQLVGTNATRAVTSYPGYWRIGGTNLAGWPNAPASNFLAGSVSDAAVYSTELSAVQVASHFAAGGHS